MDELLERRLQRLRVSLDCAGYSLHGDPGRGFVVIDRNNVIVVGEPQPLTLDLAERLADSVT